MLPSLNQFGTPPLPHPPFVFVALFFFPTFWGLAFSPTKNIGLKDDRNIVYPPNPPPFTFSLTPPSFLLPLLPSDARQKAFTATLTALGEALQVIVPFPEPLFPNLPPPDRPPHDERPRFPWEKDRADLIAPKKRHSPGAQPPFPMHLRPPFLHRVAYDSPPGQNRK